MQIEQPSPPKTGSEKKSENYPPEPVNPIRGVPPDYGKANDQSFTPSRPSPHAPKSSHWVTWVIVILSILVIVAVVVAVRKRSAAAGQAGAGRFGQQVIPVLASPVVAKNVPVYLDGLGTVQAFYTVTVHVRVDGEIKKINFVEGQDVKAGDVLAQIDPDPYQTALDQAIGKKGQDQALLANAQLDLKREVALYAAKVDSQQVYDTQKALVDQYAAAVKADQAAIESANVQLKYSTITSPIDGRTGLRQVDPGNIVHATDTNGLVVVTQLKPISVIFTLPEQTLGEIHKRLQAEGGELKVLAVGRDNTNILDEGKLAVIDNEIDTTTGTLRIKANFPNEHLNLWPGQFVNVRLEVDIRTNGLVVPATAIQRGPNGAYVFIINTNMSADASPGGKGGKGGSKSAAGAGSSSGSGYAAAKGKSGGKKPSRGGSAPGENDNAPMGKVKIQAVTVAPQVEAGEALINSGLKVGDIVVVDGQYKLQEGSTVKMVSAANAGSVDSSSANSVQ